MPIPVSCECGQNFLTRDGNAGKRAMCPDCGRVLIVPKTLDVISAVDLVPRSEPPAPVTSRKAIASLGLGLCVICVAVTGIPAMIQGFAALGEIRRSKGRLKGNAIATAGIVLGFVSTLLTVTVLWSISEGSGGARRAQCVNNLKQLGLAMHNYHSVFNSFPPAAITDKQGRPLLSWRVAVLPYAEQSALYDKFHLDEPWYSPHNMALLKERPNFYACPSDKELAPGRTNYQVLVDPRSMFPGDDKLVTFADVRDGTSNTLLVGEAKHSVPWTAPHDLPYDPTTPQSGFDSSHVLHPGGFNTLMGDGAVKYLKHSVTAKVFEALMTRDGGEVIDASSY